MIKDNTQAIEDSSERAQTLPDVLPNLRAVVWCNIWNRSAARDTDGVGTKYHLTAETGYSGKTLCGRVFPKDKGYPSTWGAGYCKRCVKVASKLGYQQGFTQGLKAVLSIESY